jgi:ppGpp synthetase/RelA/SpoT-type nucleotidyltranferase
LSDEEERLWRDAGIAKRGANDVVRRLHNLMNVGAPSIADLAYTVRLREKDDYKIVEKVLRKRKGDKTYDIGRLRDIVGLRIVTLYRLDALDIIPRLTEFMKSESGKPDSIFLSPDIEEIKIFSTNPKGDAQALPQRLRSLFDSLGYGDKAEIEGTPSNYTSIHMVTWCRGRYSDSYQNVPVEIQIRTALEDAWGEIDHKLKYKPPSQKLSVRDETILQACLAHLNVMKSFIDGAAQYADQIRVQADQVTARRFAFTTHRIIQDTSAVIRKMSLPAHIRTQIEHALEHQTEAMHASRRNRQYAESRVHSLRTALRELQVSIELAAEQLPEGDENREVLLQFYLPLEMALCYFQLGVELKADKKMLAEAVKLYEIAATKYPDRAIVLYRYGRTLAALGDLPAAIKKLEEADVLLKSGKDTTVEKTHWLRLSVPRNLGALMWETGEALKATGMADGELNSKLKELNLQAYRITKAAYEIRVDPDPLSDKFDIETGYKGRLANNLLYYIDDFLELGGTLAELAPSGYLDGEIGVHLSLLEQHFDLIDSPPTLHTMLRHYLRLGEGAEGKAAKTADLLKKALRDRGVIDTGGNSHEEEMLRLATKTLGED